ncbi:hypothetical protein [Methanosarcina sp. UBA411]|nr:hypothetical protein [Methanosarcina sp. UBA411]
MTSPACYGISVADIYQNLARISASTFGLAMDKYLCITVTC